MAYQISSGVLRPGPPSPTKQRLKSFINRRSDSEMASPVLSPMSIPSENVSAPALSLPIFSQYSVGSPLSEIHHNNQSNNRSPNRSPTRSIEKGYFSSAASPKPSPKGKSKERGRQVDREAASDGKKGPLAAFTGVALKEGASRFKSRESSPVKGHKKTKSTTNLANFLSRPKAARKDDDKGPGIYKDKENRTPPSSMAPSSQSTPIYQQFCADPNPLPSRSADPRSSGSPLPQPPQDNADQAKSSHFSKIPFRGTFTHGRAKSMSAGSSMPMHTTIKKRSTELDIDPKDIDKHLEAMLDRRNIPENQRYKMRNLANTIKMEFIRQDWAEMASAASKHKQQSKTMDVHKRQGSSSNVATEGDAEIQPAKSKRSRGRSFTLSRINKTGKKGDKTLSSLSRHLRSKSSETLADEKPLSSSFADASDGVSGNSGGGNGTGLLAKIMGTAPADFVSYLRKVTRPQAVEVGKLHKLRLLLRNEAVSWIEDFIRQGGMEEMVALLHRIMEIEWRDEHEDALLHETLLCLKALSTTAVAQVYIHSIHNELFPRLLHLLFDPEKKGPSEFTTRNIVTSILFMYIESGAPSDRISRAANVLYHLRDPEPPESERPVGFVLSMHRPRPYRVWNKEVVNVTKEVFWIFLHHLNIVAVPEKMNLDPEASSLTSANDVDSALKYMTRHFPAERPPVAAAPYVGGVEWDATNYLASHVDLLNAIIACTPSRYDRNQLRSELRVSGWERCMGGSLRLCKEKFYPSVHEALRTWVSAAMEDGWDVKDVRYGPPPESRSRSVSPSKSKVSPMTPAPLNLPENPGGGGGVTQAKVTAEAAPRLELPVPKMLSDSDSETSSMRGRNAVPPADYRADDSWLR
ncbi:hypothetical protein Cpir12675_004030 [Ceratocystis pirilliformis]|uniref:Formin GTPase-binding domain-containing protein n=1 Tax=Ceratocystis pirilliformis TaxID=259994 RepID=A0ABR3Z012_9PEZI